MLAVGKDAREVNGRLWIEPGHQPSLIVGHESMQNPFDLLRCLPLAEDDFGKTTANPAVKVDFGEFTSFLERLNSDGVRGLLGRKSSVADGFEQVLESVRIHERSLYPRGGPNTAVTVSMFCRAPAGHLTKQFSCRLPL
jgi:hypothetical protein